MIHTFHDWIPPQAKAVFYTIQEKGGYAGFPRLQTGFKQLYASSQLKPIWEKFANTRISPEGWSYLIGSIIQSLECAPHHGVTRATRDRPDEKIQELERQKRIDQLLSDISKKAEELCALLAEINQNPDGTPLAVQCSLTLIEEAIESNGWAACSDNKKHVKTMQRGMATRDKVRFPAPVELLVAMINGINRHPTAEQRRTDLPWMESNQSSWRDYWRALENAFADVEHMYGCKVPALTLTELTILLRVMLGLNSRQLSEQAVDKALKNK